MHMCVQVSVHMTLCDPVFVGCGGVRANTLKSEEGGGSLRTDLLSYRHL